MYSMLAKMVSELPYNKDVNIRIAAREAYDKATSGEPISVQEAFHIKQTLFPSVPFEELFEQDAEGQPQITEGEAIKIIKACPYWGEVYPALHATVCRYVSDKIHSFYRDTGAMAAVSYALLVGRAQGIREERLQRNERPEAAPDTERPQILIDGVSAMMAKLTAEDQARAYDMVKSMFNDWLEVAGEGEANEELARVKRKAHEIIMKSPANEGVRSEASDDLMFTLKAMINGEMEGVAKPKTLDAILSYVHIAKQRE